MWIWELCIWVPHFFTQYFKLCRVCMVMVFCVKRLSGIFGILTNCKRSILAPSNINTLLQESSKLCWQHIVGKEFHNNVTSPSCPAFMPQLNTWPQHVYLDLFWHFSRNMHFCNKRTHNTSRMIWRIYAYSTPLEPEKVIWWAVRSILFCFENEHY